MIQNENYKRLQSVLNDPSKAIRLGLFNADRHSNKNAFVKWETVEIGSIRNMLKAYQTMLLSIDDNLSRAVIEQIRKELTSTFNCIGDINGIATSTFQAFTIPNTSNEILIQLNSDAQELKTSLGLNELPYECRFLGGRNRLFRKGGQKNTEKYLEEVIDRYNSEEKTLDDIIKMVRDLERVHPYQDFNCRTFAVLILNRELVKNGFAPCIMEDPNLFDYKSLEDLRILVSQGQQNFKSLEENGLVHSQDPSNQQWYNEIESSNIDIKKEFHSITQNVYCSLEHLNNLDFLELLRSLPKYKEQFEIGYDIKIECALQLDYLNQAGLSPDVLMDIYNDNPEKIKWLVQHSKGISYLNQAGLSIDTLMDIYDNNLEKIKWLVQHSKGISYLNQTGLSIDTLMDVYDNNLEKIKWLIQHSEGISYLNQAGLSIDTLMDIYDNNLEKAKELVESYFKLDDFKREGLSEGKLNEMLKKNYEQVLWLLNNRDDINELRYAGLSINELIGLFVENPDKAKWLLQNGQKICILTLKYGASLSIDTLMGIYDNNLEKIKWLVQHSKGISYLNQAGLSIDTLMDIYDNNPEKIKWLVQHSKGISYLNQAGLSIDTLMSIYDDSLEKAKKLVVIDLSNGELNNILQHSNTGDYLTISQYPDVSQSPDKTSDCIGIIGDS